MPGFHINCSSTVYFIPSPPQKTITLVIGASWYGCYIPMLLSQAGHYVPLMDRETHIVNKSINVAPQVQVVTSEDQGRVVLFCGSLLRLHMLCFVTTPVFRHQSRYTAIKVGVHNSDRRRGGIVQRPWLTGTRAFHPAPPKRQESDRSAAITILVFVWVANTRSRLYAGASVFPVYGLAQDWLHDGEGDCQDGLFRKKSARVPY